MAMFRWTVRGCQIFPSDPKPVSLLADLVPTSCYPQSSCFSFPSFRFHHAICKAIQQKMTPTLLPAELITHSVVLPILSKSQILINSFQTARLHCNTLGQVKDSHTKNQVFDRGCPREEKNSEKDKYRVIFLRHTHLSSSNRQFKLSKWEVILTSLQ